MILQSEAKMRPVPGSCPIPILIGAHTSEPGLRSIDGSDNRRYSSPASRRIDPASADRMLQRIAG